MVHNKITAHLVTRKQITVDCWEVKVEGYLYFYNETIHKNGECVDWVLRNEFDRDINDEALLKVVQQIVDEERSEQYKSVPIS